jgi:hypothetical protein
LQESPREHYEKKENGMVRTRNYPVVIGAGVAVLLFSLVGAAAITGVLPQDIARYNPHASPLLETTASAAAAKKANCRTCGVIASIRSLEVRREGASAGTSAAQPSGEDKQRLYRVTVRMDDGTERTLTQAKAPLFAVGARVRINGSAMERG